MLLGTCPQKHTGVHTQPAQRRSGQAPATLGCSCVSELMIFLRLMSLDHQAIGPGALLAQEKSNSLSS